MVTLTMRKKTKRKSRGKTYKARSVKYTESIKRIYSGFIKPLINSIATGAMLNDSTREDTYATVMRYFFRYDWRTVLACRAKRSFLLPGHWRGGPTTNERGVSPGDILFVRFDEAQKEVVDVEFKEQEFRLLEAHWRVVKDNLEVIT